MKCLGRHSFCRDLIRYRGICTASFNHCKLLRDNTAEFVKKLADILHKKPEGRNCSEEKPKFCPLKMECIHANDTCTPDQLVNMGNMTMVPWGEECTERGHMFCPLFMQCVPSRQCSYRSIINWMNRGNNSVTPFGKPCPKGTFFKAIRMKCVSAHEGNVSESNRTTCEEGLKFCDPQYTCLPRDQCRAEKHFNVSSVSKSARDSG